MAKPKPAKKGKSSPARKNKINPEGTAIVNLNFRVPGAFKRAFKIAAATEGISQSRLLQEAFEDWKKRHPSS